ncbi:hypothetical protein [Butyrivibrio sp. AE3006]|nr:hypothetical protein [Butyrivibrio sp. AE3006]
MPYTKIGTPLSEDTLDKYMDDDYNFDKFKEEAKKNGWLTL